MPIDSPTKEAVTAALAHLRSHGGAMSIALGMTSLMLGWTLILPMAGVYLGVTAGMRDPDAHGAATWGVVLNGFALSLWVMVLGATLVSSVMWSSPV